METSAPDSPAMRIVVVRKGNRFHALVPEWGIIVDGGDPSEACLAAEAKMQAIRTEADKLGLSNWLPKLSEVPSPTPGRHSSWRTDLLLFGAKVVIVALLLAGVGTLAAKEFRKAASNAVPSALNAPSKLRAGLETMPADKLQAFRRDLQAVLTEFRLLTDCSAVSHDQKR